MPTTRKPATDRRQRETMGIVLPGALYDTHGVMLAAGIGEVLLRKLREQGLIQPVRFRERCFYRGDDIIAMIVNGSEPQPSKTTPKTNPATHEAKQEQTTPAADQAPAPRQRALRETGRRAGRVSIAPARGKPSVAGPVAKAREL